MDSSESEHFVRPKILWSEENNAKAYLITLAKAYFKTNMNEFLCRMIEMSCEGLLLWPTDSTARDINTQMKVIFN